MEYWTPGRALVVAAHPDDIEFGCAGTVARWVREGAHVTYALVTNGAAGSSDPEMTRERLAELREAEARASAKGVGVDQVEFLGYEGGRLEPVKLTGVWLMMNMEPNVVVDIGEFIDKKMESLACHVTQIGDDLGEDGGFVRGMAEFSATDQPFRYGEAFRVFRFDLPWEPPRSDPEAPLSEA